MAAVALLPLALACQDAGLVLAAQDGASPAVSFDGGVGFVDMGGGGPNCYRFAAGPEFALCTATYIGEDGPDQAVAVGIGADGEVVVAGNFATLPFDIPEPGDAGDRSGALLRFDSTGTRSLGAARVDARIWDMAVQQASAQRIAIATEAGVAVYDDNGAEQTWSFELPVGAERVTIGETGTVAALDGEGVIHLFNAAGSPIAAFAVDAPTVADIAIDDQRDLVFAVGSRGASGACDGPLPFLRAYDFTSRLAWRAYDFEDPGAECAPSQGDRIELGRDGMLYYAGHNRGGDSVHLKDPSDVDVLAPISSYDEYTRGSGVVTETHGFVARFNPETGEVLGGQALLPRDGETGGRLAIHAIDADARGHVYLAGESACCIDARDAISVGGQMPGPYDDGDMFVAILAPDFSERLSWVTWTGPDGVSGVASGIAVGERFAAVVANQRYSVSPMITHAALQAAPKDATDAFLSVWPAAR